MPASGIHSAAKCRCDWRIRGWRKTSAYKIIQVYVEYTCTYSLNAACAVGFYTHIVRKVDVRHPFQEPLTHDRGVMKECDFSLHCIFHPNTLLFHQQVNLNSPSKDRKVYFLPLHRFVEWYQLIQPSTGIYHSLDDQTLLMRRRPWYAEFQLRLGLSRVVFWKIPSWYAAGWKWNCCASLVFQVVARKPHLFWGGPFAGARARTGARFSLHLCILKLLQVVHNSCMSIACSHEVLQGSLFARAVGLWSGCSEWFSECLQWGWLPGGMSSVWSLGSSHWDTETPQKHRIPCATHSADAMQLEPHGSASAGTSSFAIQAHCFGRAIEHLRKVQLHVLPERVQRLGGLDGRTLSRSDLD